jgi:hypothetical protein
VYPKDFAVRNLGRTQAAFLYADASLGFLLRELESRGVLEETLVLITSDESRGVKPESGATPLRLDRPTLEFSQNWGILIALQPEGLVGERSGLFAQMDLALSVVDYLGFPDEAGNFMGRSVFRRYDKGRYMPFGNTNMLKVGLIHPSGTITRCRFLRDTCVSRMHPKGRFFAPSPKRAVRSTPEEQELTMALARASHVESLSGVHDRTIPLVSQDRMAVERSRYFHAGPFISLDPGQWIEVEYELEVYGESGEMKFTHKLQESKRWAEDAENRVRGKLVNERVMIKPGQTLYLRYSVVPELDDDMQGIKLTSKGVRGRFNPPFQVSFRKAVLRVSSSPDRPPVGVTILDKRIETSNSSGLRSRDSEGAALPGLD